MLLKNTDIGKRTLNALAKKNIITEDGLARFLPRMYKDYRTKYYIHNCPLDAWCAIACRIKNVQIKEGRRQYLSIRAESIEEEHGIVTPFSILLFSRTFLYETYYGMTGQDVVVTGRPHYDETYGYTIPEPDRIVREADFVPRIVPVYPKIGGVSSEMMDRLVKSAVNKAHEPFEWELMMESGPIPDYKSALTMCHVPRSPEEIRDGRKRLLMNDLLYFAIGLKEGSSGLKTDTPVRFTRRSGLDAFLSSLPYSLTEDQNRVLVDICRKASGGTRVNALIQGDVGSGKTVLAVAFMVLAAENGYQSVLMAPRGVLAGQHYASVREMTGFPDEEIAYLHSGMKASERRKVLKSIKEGSARFIIGTHSCLSDDVEYHSLGVVVTDEEHLFGVRQKEAIVDKARMGAHILSMSATPIPRTLAGVVYGEDKTVEQIRSMPEGRLPVKTAVVSERVRAMAFMLREIKCGHQCYVVCPAIDENESTDIVSIEAVEGEYRKFFEKYGIQIGVVNGKMDAKEADTIINGFSSGILSVLIATTVVEVGVNVPNSTVIVIEQAERFGLASLHQLRGRVGRGNSQSYCILRSDDTANDRLKVIAGTTDGFAIAEADLKLRGSGDLLGTQQAGQNRYVELMLSHPDEFRKAAELADFCIRNGFGKNLVSLCAENDNAT